MTPRSDDEEILARSLGEQIRSLRSQRGWTQRRLAEMAGVVQQNLSLYERGLASPRLSTLGRLAAALGAEIRLQPTVASAASEPQVAPGLTLPELMDYVDRQVRRVLEQERARAPKRSKGAG